MPFSLQTAPEAVQTPATAAAAVTTSHIEPREALPLPVAADQTPRAQHSPVGSMSPPATTAPTTHAAAPGVPTPTGTGATATAPTTADEEVTIRDAPASATTSDAPVHEPKTHDQQLSTHIIPPAPEQPPPPRKINAF